MKNGRIKINKRLAGGFITNPISRIIISKVAKKIPKSVKNRKRLIGKMGTEITEGMKKIYKGKVAPKKLFKDTIKANQSFRKYLRKKSN
jgi:hypothetical protein